MKNMEEIRSKHFFIDSFSKDTYDRRDMTVQKQVQ